VRVILAALSKTIKDSSCLKQAARLARFLRSEDCVEKFLKAESVKEVYELSGEAKGGKSGITKS
jgi:mannitol/fructose-specific phosphotransferase system IIA component (Ntr-type)